VELCGETEGLEPPPGDRGGSGGVIDEILSLSVEFAPAGGTGWLRPCNLGSRI